MIKIEIKSTTTVDELNGQFNFKYRVITPKGNIAGDGRKLRAMTSIDLSKGLEFELNLLDDDFAVQFKKKTGIRLERWTEDDETKDSNVFVSFSRDAKDVYGTDHIGAEVAIGKLEKEDFEKILGLLEEDRYFNSNYMQEWFNYDEIYHNHGALLVDAEDFIDVEDFVYQDDLESQLWALDQDFLEEGKGLNNIIIPTEGTYLLTVRNSDFMFVADANIENNNEKHRIQLHYDSFEILQGMYANMGIIHTAKINDNELTLDNEAAEGACNIYDTQQFIISNGEVIGWISNLEEESPSYQWETAFEEREDDLGYISPFTRMEDDEYYENCKGLIMDRISEILND